MQGSLERPRDCGVPDMDIGLNVEVLRTEISLLISSPQGSHMHLLSDPCIKSTSLFFFYFVNPVNPVKLIEAPRCYERDRQGLEVAVKLKLISIYNCFDRCFDFI